MLVLTRRLEQAITIGDPLSPADAIEVTVLEVRGDQVRLGIKAPATTAVHRAEVYKQIQQDFLLDNSLRANGQRKII